MIDDFQNTMGSLCRNIFTPFLQWDRLRHPYAGWARLALGILLPFIIWSHNWLLIGMWVIAVLSHPYWFPPYVDAGEDTPIFTRLVDAWQRWLEDSAPHEKLFAFFPALIMFLPFISSLWAHGLFWSIYFFLMIVGYKIIFSLRLLLKKDPQ